MRNASNSARQHWPLRQIGYTSVANLEGGLSGWHGAEGKVKVKD